MASLSFDANSVDITSRDPIPAGIYEALICDSEVRPTRSGNGKGINLTFEILSDGPAKGRKVFVWINYEHPKVEAQRIGREELASLCKAVGVANLTDTNQLHNLPLMITVAIDRNDPSRNVVKKYAAKAGNGQQGTGNGATVQTAPATASGTPPWRR